MPVAALSHAVLTLSLAALGVGPHPGDPLSEPSPAITEIHQVLYAVEGSELNAVYPVNILCEISGCVSPEVVLAVPPVYGQFTEGVWPSFTYEPDGNYFGRDRLTVEVYGSSTMARVEFEIDVLPRRIPLVGRWAEATAPAAGLYDPLGGWLQRCSPADGGPGHTEGGELGQAEAGQTEGSELVRTLSCTWIRVRDAPAAAILLVLPGPKDDADRLALFAQSTGTLYFLSDEGSELVVDKTEVYPAAADRFPVAGYFDDSDQATIAFVGRGGEVGMLGRRSDWIEWSRPIELAPSDELPWPFRWPLEGRDALALLEPGTGNLNWWTAEGDSDSLKSDAAPTAVPLPFWPHRQDLHESVSLLWRTPNGLYVVNYTFGGLFDPSPETYPLKFPNDPP